MARRGRDYGFAVSTARVNMAAVKRRKDRVVRQSIEGLKKWIGAMERVELVHGHARFLGARRIGVNGRTLEAERVFNQAQELIDPLFVFVARGARTHPAQELEHIAASQKTDLRG